MISMTCPRCSSPMRAEEIRRVVSRGSQHLDYRTPAWICSRHPDLPGGREVVMDPEQIEQSHARAQSRWKRRFGEDLPPARRAGRRPSGPSARTVRVQLLLTQEEAEMLDTLRGSRSRSGYLRGPLSRASRIRRWLEASPLVKSVFLDGAPGRWELQLVRPRGFQPRTLSVDAPTLDALESRVLIALMGLPDEVRYRLAEDGVRWTRASEPWRHRTGPLDDALRTRLIAETSIQWRATDDARLPHLGRAA